ncbi:MAG: GrpB family protein [Candidatus Micrarchaeaceae archaeon]|jgi:GrpB-like predicted nucleotidyltransferase (UPF0157 family)
MKKYVFRKYNIIYKNFFKVEKRKLLVNLNKDIIIEHIGSTAIPDLGGKNILDIVIGSKHSKLKGLKTQLEKLGYEFRETAGTQKRLFFRKDYKYNTKFIRVHIHLVKFKSKDWKEMITFRDHLINNKTDRMKYIVIKKKAAKLANGNGDIYKKTKKKFIDQITRKALRST